VGENMENAVLHILHGKYHMRGLIFFTFQLQTARSEYLSMPTAQEENGMEVGFVFLALLLSHLRHKLCRQHVKGNIPGISSVHNKALPNEAFSV
jgi:hypothetical protein